MSGARAIGTTRRKDTVSDKRIWLDLDSNIESWNPPDDVSAAFLCAAVSSLDQCRVAPDRSRAVNVHNTARIAAKLVDKGCMVVFPSTNLVYDGTVPFRRPEEKVCPATEYGRQKAETEQRLLFLGSVAVVRLTKVLPTNAPLFADWREKLLDGKAIQPFSDMAFSPLPLQFVTEVLMKVVKNELRGIIQVSADRDITYEDAARFMAGRLNASPAQVQPIQATALKGRTFEAVPQFTTLEITRLRTELQLTPPDVWSTIGMACAL